MSASGEQTGPPDLNGPHCLWQKEVILWQGQIPNEAAWREDPHLRERLRDDSPDVLQVLFLNPSGSQAESMWVRVIGVDAQVDPQVRLCLGILLSEPDIIESVSQAENICFASSSGAGCPMAVTFLGEFRRAGLPHMVPEAFFNEMARGLRLYRLGNFGHNPSALDSAIAVFHNAAHEVSSETGDQGAFYLHFYLARCHAERGNTQEAIAEFEKAITHRPDDEDSHMGLLAELSLLVNAKPSLLPSGTATEWEARFETQVALIKATFPPTAYCTKQIDAMYASSAELDLGIIEDNPTDVESEERRRPRVFRWRFK